MAATTSTFTPIFERECCFIAKQRLELLYRNLLRNEEWNLGERIDVKQQVDALKSIFERESRDLESRKDELESMMSQNESSYAPVYTAVRDRVMAQEAPLMVELKELVEEISKNTGDLYQSVNDLVPLYYHAMEAKPLFDEFITNAVAAAGLKADALMIADLKHPYRAIEKMAMREKRLRFRCDKVYDIVRCAVLCESLAESVAALRAIHATPPDAEHPPFNIDSIKDRWNHPTSEGWSDIRINGHMQADTNQHKCEIQIIHRHLMLVREEMGGHHFYAECRGVIEALEIARGFQYSDGSSGGAAGGGGQVDSDLKTYLMQQEQEAVEDDDFERAAQIKDSLDRLEILEAELKEKEDGKKAAVKKRDYDTAGKLSKEVKRLKEEIEIIASGGLSGGAMGNGAAEELAAPAPMINPSYPNLNMSGYINDTLFCKLNTSYPGLQLIHEKPYIFIVNNFLNQAECNKMLAKVGANMAPSVRSTNTIVRTSTTAIAENSELPEFRDRVGNLTNQRQDQLQYTKITRYEKGQMFGEHLDASAHNDSDVFNNRGKPSQDYYGDRIIAEKGMWTTFNKPCVNRFCTVFVYLNTCERGGATTFTWMGKHLGENGGDWYEKPISYSTTAAKGKAEPKLSIRPEMGMAVIHFPCTAPHAGGYVDFNTTHAGEEAIDEKYIVQQFIYSDRYQLSSTSKDHPKGRLSAENF